MVDNYEGDSVSAPWRRFYKWYFASENESFVLRATHQEKLILRRTIIGYEVNITVS